MTSKLTITDERIEKIAVWLATESHSLNLEMLTCLRELQERRKAERDSEPVAYTDDRNLGYIDRGRETAYLWGKQNSEAADVPLYRHAQQPAVPDGLIAAVNRLLDSDGSRGCYSAIRCHDARAEVERLLAAAPQEVQGE